MGIEASRFDKTGRLVLRRFKSPVGALELADQPARVLSILDEDARRRNLKVIRQNTYMDFVFIALYGSIFWLFSEAYPGDRGLSRLVKLAIVVAALFDFAENTLMLSQYNRIKSLSERFDEGDPCCVVDEVDAVCHGSIPAGNIPLAHGLKLA